MILFDNSRKKVKTPLVLQMETSECGIACLSIILKYFGKDISIEQLRDDFCLGRNGTKASTIIKIAQKYQLNAKGFKLKVDSLSKLKVPMILFWNQEHYVVYEGQGKNGNIFYINDPQCGRLALDRETFEKGFSGVALTFNKEEGFEPTVKNGKNSIFSIFNSGSQTLLITVFWASILLVLPIVAIPMIFSVYIDYVVIEKTNWLTSLVLMFLLVVGIKIILLNVIDLSLRRLKLQKLVNTVLKSLNLLFALPLRFFIQRSNGEIQTKMSLHSILINQLVMKFKINSVYFMTSLFYLCMMLGYCYKLALVAVFCALIYTWIYQYIAGKESLLQQQVQLQKSSLFSSVVSNLSSIDAVKALGREKSIFNIWSEKLTSLNNKILKHSVHNAYLDSVLILIALLSNICIFILGITLVVSGSLSLGNLFSFQIIISGFVFPLTMVIKDNQRIKFIDINEAKISDLYHYKHAELFLDKCRHDDTDSGNFDEFYSFDLKNISFKYDDEQHFEIQNFSLHIEPGQHVAIVGASGAGKSTIARIISGLLKPDNGEILLNNKNVREITAETYYSNIDIVEQNPTFFAGTIQENLTMFSQTFDYESLQDALRVVGLVDELSINGSLLSMRMEENGTNFSQGQLQRLEIARVLANQKPLALFDEATSCLDAQKNREINNIIRRYVRSFITISHNLDTIKKADEIIVLDHGVTVGRGTHQELSKNNKYYQSLMLINEGENLW